MLSAEPPNIPGKPNILLSSLSSFLESSVTTVILVIFVASCSCSTGLLPPTALLLLLFPPPPPPPPCSPCLMLSLNVWTNTPLSVSYIFKIPPYDPKHINVASGLNLHTPICAFILIVCKGTHCDPFGLINFHTLHVLSLPPHTMVLGQSEIPLKSVLLVLFRSVIKSQERGTLEKEETFFFWIATANFLDFLMFQGQRK